ncbi:hypothetical protein CSC94_01195 [Zhengella mangrovi]|uniref:L,D-TPase catalytic domain-containing protein n=1 Tax=Zhengella mangrovi TaxID=1982044 RepID=A0A2G1QSX8_9HYPH|nr:L,D-transpeptidase family protein [Zhengella mangrovi]PHP68647.1 hypothetical protein CSC94_01195 [Zhengella mangrovi]
MAKPALLFGLGTAMVIALLGAGWFWPEAPLPAAARADLIVVSKHERMLEVRQGDTILKRYRVALGSNPVGPKARQGDGRTPEGRYLIDSRNRASRFHLALHVSYPSAADRARARAAGVSPGGDIMVHGIRNGLGWIGRLHALVDWTNGCIAVTDEQIEEIWAVTPNGTPIEIRP